MSELGLGCGTFGVNWGPLGSDLEESKKIFTTFAEAGGNFLDTSNRYQESQSEQWIGDFVKGNRDFFVIGTKYSLGDGAADFNGLGLPTNHSDPNNRGNHRKNLRRSVEASLRRMQTDYIDLLWVHIWDYTTPYDEILNSIHDLICAGKVLYAGLSNVPAWEVARMNTLADCHGKHPFIAVQNEWSLVERSHEPEFVPMCKALDLGVVCWSPLAGGMVSGKYNAMDALGEGPHRLIPHVLDKEQFWYPVTQRNLRIMESLAPLLNEIGEPYTATALRWLMQQTEVVSVPVFSVRTHAQLLEALRATEFTLDAKQMQAINDLTEDAIASIAPPYGPFPYPMLNFGGPSLPNFFSRDLLHGNTEDAIINHRTPKPYLYEKNV